MEETLDWLKDWEKKVKECLIPENEFLSRETAEGLRVTIRSTLDLCKYLIENFRFEYLLTGKVNQDNLEVQLLVAIFFFCYIIALNINLKKYKIKFHEFFNDVIKYKFLQKFFGTIRNAAGGNDL